MSYAESDSEGAEEDDDIFKLASKAKRARPLKRRKLSESGDEDTYEAEDIADDGMSRGGYLRNAF